MLFLLLIISGGEYAQYAVSGSLVMTMVSFGLALGEDVAYYRLDYRMIDLFVASPISQFSFMMGLALSELLFGLPAILILIYLVFYFGYGGITVLPIIILSSILIWGTMSGIGFFVSSFMSHTRNVRQLISLITIIVAVIPPIFYSIEILPPEMRYISYGLPTTHASLVIQYAMGYPTPSDWSLFLGLFIHGAYLFAFLGLASKRAVWRER